MDHDYRREEWLTSIVRLAGYARTRVFVSHQPQGLGDEGSHDYTGFGGNWDVDVTVASWLTEPQAEATALHELAHLELGHDDDPAYAAAKARDAAAGIDQYRGPWEAEADALAAAMAEPIASKMTDIDASLAFLAEDAARYA